MPLRAQAVQVANAANLEVYRDPEIVSHYASLDYLTPCERFLFDTYLKPGMAILDIGVGGGRTTAYLSRRASRYVGVDYSEEMIRACQRKFPGQEFCVADASDLSVLSAASFDAIVIAFNGLDCIFPEERRWQCLRECNRLLRAGGLLVFSSHNSQSIFGRPAWDRERLRSFTAKLVSEQNAFFRPTVWVLTIAKAMHSLGRAAIHSFGQIWRRVPKAAFWRGEGYLFDPAHGGSMTHCWTPVRVWQELRRFDFRQVEVLGDDYPRRSHRFVTDWYYYVFSKAGSSTGDSCG